MKKLVSPIPEFPVPILTLEQTETELARNRPLLPFNLMRKSNCLTKYCKKK